jgi:branched-chain amino acid transport system permease protein
MMRLLTDGISGVAWLLLGLTGVVLLAAPWFLNDYLITILILIFYYAYVGQAWNIMMGFSGQLSLGHALYVGLGAYAAAALYVHFGIGPWVGMFAGIVISGLVAVVLGYLAFRFGVGGVYFAILTIAFAEFARIGFDHFKWVNASSGLFLPVAQYTSNNVWTLRGSPAMFYYVLLALMVIALVICRLLLRSRLGYYWQAIREDELAAQSVGINTFRCKVYAVTISAAMTSVAGMVYAFFYNNLFPEQVFNIGRSIEIILGPIIGGIGTLIGPVVGALILQVFSESTTELLDAFGVTTPGAKQICYGVVLLVVIVLMPHGVWPPIARALGLSQKSGDGK